MAAKSNTDSEDLQGKGADNGFAEDLKWLGFQRHEGLRLVPTIDEDVKGSLILLKEPESLAGEDAFSRRERLAELIFKNKHYRDIFEASIYYKDGTDEQNMDEEDEVEEEEEEDFYTPASGSLIDSRKFLIRYSLNKARERLMKESQRFQEFDMTQEIKKRRHFAMKTKNIELMGSQVVSTRPVSQVSLSPNGSLVAAASWAGDLTILNSQTLEILQNKPQIHMGKIGGIHWSPTGDLITAGGEEGSVKLFGYKSNTLEEMATLNGHENRVTDSKFHPSGRFIASASFDMTWRLWDVETQEELLLQEGHGKELYSLGFQCDGSLVCSGGIDCKGLVWDIRSGKRAMSLSGHTKPIYSLDWSPNGYQVATGSGDGTIRIWDLRKPEEYQTILAHKSIVTKVAFEKNGNCLVSSGYDKSINLYGAYNWAQLTTLEGHMDKILCVDISENASSVVSCGWDRSVKLWTMQN
ncbi:hypothetical protein ZYGR_0N00300 [Zygosaccharomyces rouxii]|uniref:Uncharacterized protein n=1 Tax=Zygosaccharomyces rouxii TaxID=4956 RepID=A0A1Q2ZYV1_ZYGRO|nr:hypothetical protein ZYGR_0N00300 [Zygosaccharomyces rouxii]